VTELATEILVHARPWADADLILRQIVALDGAIDRERDPQRRREMCAQYRALNWARAPHCFAPPTAE